MKTAILTTLFVIMLKLSASAQCVSVPYRALDANHFAIGMNVEGKNVFLVVDNQHLPLNVVDNRHPRLAYERTILKW